MSRCFVGSDRHKNCYRKEAIVLPSNELVDQVEKKAVPRFVGKTKCSVLYLRERSEERLCRLIFVSGFFEEGSWTNRAWNVAFSDELHEKKVECCHCQVQSSWNESSTETYLFFILILYVLWKFISHIII